MLLHQIELYFVDIHLIIIEDYYFNVHIGQLNKWYVSVQLDWHKDNKYFDMHVLYLKWMETLEHK